MEWAGVASYGHYRGARVLRSRRHDVPVEDIRRRLEIVRSAAISYIHTAWRHVYREEKKQYLASDRATCRDEGLARRLGLEYRWWT